MLSKEYWKAGWYWKHCKKILSGHSGNININCSNVCTSMSVMGARHYKQLFYRTHQASTVIEFAVRRKRASTFSDYAWSRDSHLTAVGSGVWYQRLMRKRVEGTMVTVTVLQPHEAVVGTMRRSAGILLPRRVRRDVSRPTSFRTMRRA